MQIVDPLHLSIDELRKYDGSDSALPIYLAIRGTIFDVSKGIFLALTLSCHTLAQVLD